MTQRIGQRVKFDPKKRVEALLNRARELAKEGDTDSAMGKCRKAIERILKTQNEQINGSIPEDKHLWGLIEPIKQHLTRQTMETMVSINAQTRHNLHENDEPDAKLHHVESVIHQICSVYTDLYESELELGGEANKEVLKSGVKTQISDDTEIEWNSIDEWGLALGALKSKRLRTAEKHLMRALDMFRNEGNKLAEGFALGNLGLVALYRGNYQNAGNYYQDSIAIMKDLSYAKGLCGAMNSYAGLLRQIGKIEKSEQTLLNALKISEESSECHPERVEILTNIAIHASENGDYMRAKETYLNLLKFVEEFGVEVDITNLYHNLAGIEKTLGNFDVAVKLIQQCIEIKGPYPKALMVLGEIALNRSGPRLAEPLILDALRLAEERGDVLDQVGALNNLAGIARNYDLPKSRFYIERSIEMLSKVDNPKQEATSFLTLANICQDQHDFESAIQNYEHSLQIFRHLNNPKEEGVTLQNLANCYDQYDRPDDAEKYIDQSIEIFKQIGYSYGKANSYITKGNLAVRRNEHNSGYRYFNLALEIYGELGLQRERLGTMLNIGLIMANTGHVDQAEEQFNSLIQLNRTLPEPALDIESIALANMAEICSSRGDSKKGEQLMDRANRIRRNMGMRDFVSDI